MQALCINMNIDKSAQIRAILELRYFDGTGPLAVSRSEIEKYVEKNGLPRSAPRSGEIGYECRNDCWIIIYYEKNINIGQEAFETESGALSVILDSALPAYRRHNA